MVLAATLGVASGAIAQEARGTLRRRKKGRDTVQGIPSRFIGEMKLNEQTRKEDPREKLKALRAEFAARAAAKQQVS